MLLLALAILLGDPAARPPTLFVVGDSTVKTGTKGQQGWGDPLADHFDPARLRVENHAVGGRSSRTFRSEGKWDRVLAASRPGDFVLVQFGHNDAGPLDDAARARGSLRGTGDETKEIDNPLTKKREVVHTYGWYLRQYVAEARAKTLTVILVAPVPRCPTKLDVTEKNVYVGWAEDVARTEGVPFLNLHKLVLARYAALTPTGVKEKYFTPADNTHTSPGGAALNAACVAEGLRALADCPLKDHLRPGK